MTTVFIGLLLFLLTVVVFYTNHQRRRIRQLRYQIIEDLEYLRKENCDAQDECSYAGRLRGYNKALDDIKMTVNHKFKKYGFF
jgi:hypothetical protein